MRRRGLISVCLLLPSIIDAQTPSATQRSAVQLVEAQRAELITLSDQIWAFAETALSESRSAEALVAYAERKGFTVERGVAGMPTAFVATFGSGKPVIGIMGEFDALPAGKGSGLWIEDRGVIIPPRRITRTPRVGVSYAGPLWANKRYRLRSRLQCAVRAPSACRHCWRRLGDRRRHARDPRSANPAYDLEFTVPDTCQTR
jgi:hypothetical protein